MKRGLASAVLLSLVMLVPAQLAVAGEKWCEEDPVLTIDGRTVDYTASFPSAYLAGTKGQSVLSNCGCGAVAFGYHRMRIT